MDTTQVIRRKRAIWVPRRYLCSTLCLVAVIQNKATIIGDHNIRALEDTFN